MQRTLSRRTFLKAGALLTAAEGLRGRGFGQRLQAVALDEVDYAQVTVKSAPHVAQLQNTHSILMGFDNRSLLKPFRAMAGQDAPGETLGGWYEYKADYDYKTDQDGLAPSATFGQWVSALARNGSSTGDQATREKVLTLNRLYAKTIAPVYYERNRFPAYCYDKLVCGLMDAHRLSGDPDAFRILDATTDAAVGQLPGHAVDREIPWRAGKDVSWNWDESYTIPENLYLVYAMGAGRRYLDMAGQYLDDKTYFDPLSKGINVLGGKHAYSYVNALCSAMQAYMVGGSGKHLDAARNGFDMLEQQSFATGGWGPDELLRAPGSGEVFASLTKSHNSFETPCGSYAHMKLTRYLLRVTRDGRYGDSMERVMYNSVLGVKPIEPDGHAFYYSDYNFGGKRVYSDHRWPCCSGTLPQVAADYGINTYFRESGGLWVNLYIPSVLRWREGSASLALEQLGDYPYSDRIELRVTASSATNFALHLRIPAWAEEASIRVNGRAFPVQVSTGFAQIRRTWKTGDRVELELPSKPRLQPIDPAHPETVAVLEGPLVLFAVLPAAVSADLPAAMPVTASAQPAVTRKQALGARKVAREEWVIETGSGPLTLRPFVDLGDQPYTTYLKLT